MDKRLLELAHFVKNTFEPIIQSHTFPKSEIEVFIQILQTDGGILHTAINATCLAMIDAGIPMTDYIVSCSAGFANQTAFLDLNYTEESADASMLTIAVTAKSPKVSMLHVILSHLDGI